MTQLQMRKTRRDVMRKFFHWHLAFPDVFRLTAEVGEGENTRTGWYGGFSALIGNPPWERVKLQEKEWFAERAPKIASASNAAKRRKMVASPKHEDPALYESFCDAQRDAEGISHILRDSSFLPLCGRGDVNTYAVFTELNTVLINSKGRVGCIVPSGIATDERRNTGAPVCRHDHR